MFTVLLCDCLKSNFKHHWDVCCFFFFFFYGIISEPEGWNTYFMARKTFQSDLVSNIGLAYLHQVSLLQEKFCVILWCFHHFYFLFPFLFPASHLSVMQVMWPVHEAKGYFNKIVVFIATAELAAPARTTSSFLETCCFHSMVGKMWQHAARIIWLMTTASLARK